MSRYIDADKLKEHYMWWGGGFTANCKDGQKEVKKIFDEIIDLQPTADVRENVKGEWIDYSDEGYVECPFCHSATNCDDNKDELHYCFSCGAELR